MKIITLIPVYKQEPSDDEILSLRQCFNILRNYDIRLVCPQGLDTAAYNDVIGKQIPTERFAEEFFIGIEGYNNLMLSHDFYKRFQKYDYMLIYQLDAWVFYDSLEEWCDKGYDYVGAPWFELHKTHEEGYGLWCCGNGGLSLRKIKKFITVTNPYTPLTLSLKEIYKKYFRHNKKIWEGLKFILFKNNLKHFRKEKSNLWEDTYFSYGLDETRHRLYRPTAAEAALFSMECSPAYLYELIGKKLPFGCHAWRKYQYNDFWIRFIR